MNLPIPSYYVKTNIQNSFVYICKISEKHLFYFTEEIENYINWFDDITSLNSVNRIKSEYADYIIEGTDIEIIKNIMKKKRQEM